MPSGDHCDREEICNVFDSQGDRRSVDWMQLTCRRCLGPHLLSWPSHENHPPRCSQVLRPRCHRSRPPRLPSLLAGVRRSRRAHRHPSVRADRAPSRPRSTAISSSTSAASSTTASGSAPTPKSPTPTASASPSSTPCAPSRLRCCAGPAAASPTRTTGATASAPPPNVPPAPPSGDSRTPTRYGLHEFMHTCRAIGCKPYLAADMRSLPARDFYQEIEYCNAPAGPIPSNSAAPAVPNALAAQRAANGDAEPFNVDLWGVGNESWGCGGNLVPEEYAAMFRRFTAWTPSYSRDPAPLRRRRPERRRRRLDAAAVQVALRQLRAPSPVRSQRPLLHLRQPCRIRRRRRAQIHRPTTTTTCSPAAASWSAS